MASKAVRDPHADAEHFRRRALVGFAIAAVALAGLAVRFWVLQVRLHDEFSARSYANRVLTRPLVPARGLIFDRNGVVLADNAAAFRLDVTPSQVPDMPAMLAALRTIVPLSDDDIARFNALRKGKRAFQPVPLRALLPS